MKNQITACVDGSAISTAVCDLAAWVSASLNLPLTFLHVIEKQQKRDRGDLSGVIGLGSREHLLQELTTLDEQRNKLVVEHGKHIIADAKARAEVKGGIQVRGEQRHGSLLESLRDYEPETGLFVIGRCGEDHDMASQAIGSHIENLVRAVHTPILMAVDGFNPPSKYLLAYDGSENANLAIKRMAKLPLLKTMEGHLVMVGAQEPANQQALASAADGLRQAGFSIAEHLLQGDVVDTLMQFQFQHEIDFKVMGAYGHSRIREFFVGSHTTRMLATSTVPVLILR